MKRVLFSLAMLLPAIPRAIAAQGVGAEWVLANTKDPDLMGARSGVGAVLHFPITPRLPLRGRLSVQRIAGSRDTTRVTCTGLLPIGADCGPEGSTTTSRFLILGFGAEIAAFRSKHVAVLVNADLLAAKVNGNTVGHRTGNGIGGDATMTGVDGGAELVWWPVGSADVAITAGGQVGTISRVTSSLIIDGYNPFVDAIHLRRFTLGIGWRPRY